ncbi:CD209 antigen-like protein C [Stegostoma tigrinum]|uniref:CD209 antigen-like protein C n=1 Tax=Stegostoma tigrinum TaxID=3053191 RepID=UPI00286FD642|nr:CD209 antigen-like protein C [Stegostoma tigrinum]
MELDNIYSNLENSYHDQRKQSVKQQNLKPEHGVQSTEPVRGTWSHLVVYILLALSILLSLTTLTVAMILFTELFSHMKMVETDFEVDLAELKSNVTELFSHMKMVDTDFKMDLAQLQTSGLSEKTSSSLIELRNDISQLKKKLLLKCPEHWRQFQQKCYYFSSDSKSWTEAQRSCASMDANLLVINKPEEQEFVKQWIASNDHWIGLTDSVSEADWRWVDGTDYTSSVKYWGSDQPNGKDQQGENENCAVTSKNAGWHDWPCSSLHYSICEKSAQCCFL